MRCERWKHCTIVSRRVLSYWQSAQRLCYGARRENKEIVIHISLAYYGAYIAESEDLPSMIWGSKKTLPSHQCPFTETQMLQTVNIRERPSTLKATLVDYHDATENKDNFLDGTQHTVHSVMLMILRAPSFEIHSCVGIYFSFDFDSVHVLSLGISELLKRFFSSSLNDAEIRTSASKSKSGSCRKCK